MVVSSHTDGKRLRPYHRAPAGGKPLKFGEDSLEILERIPEVFFALDGEWCFTYVNSEAERVLQRTREELLGKNVWEEFPEAVGSAFYREYHKAIAERMTVEFEKYYSPLETWFEVTAYPSKVGLLVHFRDVNERKRAEKELREYEERLRAVLVQYASDVITILEADGTIRYQSPAVERVMGYRPEELKGTKVFDHVHPEEVEQARSRFGELLGYPGNYGPVEVRFRHADGSWRHFEGVGNNLLDDPSVRGIVVNSRDVTERKRAEKALEGASRRNELILNSAGEGIFELDTQGNTTFINPAASRTLGYELDELVGRPMHETVHRSYPDGTYYPIKDCPIYVAFKDGDVHSSSDEVFWRKDGTAVPVEYTSTPIRENGVLVGAVVAFRDLTERKRAEEALRESERRFRQLFENSIDALFVIHDETREIVDCNLEACRSLGYSREELLALRLEDFAVELISEEEKEHRGPDTPWRRALAGEPGTIIGFHDNVHRRKDGTTFPVEAGVGSINYGGRRMILASCRDATQRKALEDELAYRAFHDPLTDLPNRALFLDRLEHALSRTQRRYDSVAVLFLDLDDFKVVNDSLRHEVGDQLLVAVGQRLAGCLRPSATAARMGGDEFIVLLEGVSDAGDAENVAERIIQELGAPFTIEGHLVFITASIGIALSDAAGGESGNLLRAADIALYRAKNKDKARYEVFDPSKDAHALERLDLENDLRRAIERDELRVHYQPVFSLVSDHIAGLEALLRWEHPEHGTMSPAEFIPLAEESGLIVPVGRWVLEEACRQAREWQEQCPSDPPPIMGVNLSLRQFQHPGLADDVARILQETGHDPGNLALEITESVAMHDVDSTVATLEELKALGVWLVIDDFGTGHSSVSYLTNQFNMDHLKIDGSFIREFVEDPDNSAIIPGLIDFAHAVGLRVIAEGVETTSQLRRLKKMGCEFVQGTIIAGPLTPAAASELLARKAFSSGGKP